MLVACQRDSYRRALVASVVAVSERAAPPGTRLVELSDTVLFPEGGGQPPDHGRMRPRPGGDAAWLSVRDVQRLADGRVVHAVADPLAAVAPGMEVDVEVDWPRRFDHMQQHTAQHLLSALAEALWGDAGRTRAWSLGADACTVEFEARPAAEADLRELEARANAAIRDARSVRVRETSAELLAATDAPAALDAAPPRLRARDIAAKGVAALRLVEIDGIDLNPCCGTHVAALAELQLVVLTGLEPPRRGHPVVAFLAGGRVARRLLGAVDRERALTGALSTGPAGHADAVRRLATDLADLRRAAKALWRDLAPRLARDAADAARIVPPHGRALADLHAADADAATLLAMARDALERVRPRCPAGALAFATSADAFVLVSDGPDDAARGAAARLGPRAAAALDGKGGGKLHFQGRMASLKGRADAVEALATGLAE